MSLDFFVRALQRKRAALLKEIAELREGAALVQNEASRRLDGFEAQRSPLETKLHYIEQLLVIEAPEAASSSALLDNVNKERRPRSAFIAEAAYTALKEVGHPLYYKELALTLLRKGVILSGRDAAATLLSHLARDDRFVRPEKRGEYGLKEWYGRVKNVGQRKATRRKQARGGKSVRRAASKGGTA